MKLFLDDLRDCPEGFTLYRPQDLPMFYMMARHCKKGDIISLDHDLGDGFPTGYEILNNLEKQVREQFMWCTGGMPEILIHSANPVGRQNMERAIKAIQNFIELRG